MAVYITEVSVKFCPSKEKLTQEVEMASLRCLAKPFQSVLDRQSRRLNLTANSRTTESDTASWKGPPPNPRGLSGQRGRAGALCILNVLIAVVESY